MRKYDINNFYVGILNFPLSMGSILHKDIVPKEDKDKKGEFDNTVLGGAIDLRLYESGDDIEWHSRIHTIKLYTIFYKVDDVHYFCLHNRNYYNNSGIYCDNLVKIIEVLPKIDVIYDNSLSFGEAVKLFKYLFCCNNLKICKSSKTNFKIENFYQGTTSLCKSYYTEGANAFNSKSHFMNLPERLIYSNNMFLFQESGYSKRSEDNIEYSFNNYNTVFIKTPNDKYYSLNDYNFYNLDSDGYNTEVKMERPFMEVLEEKGIVYPKEVTIPKVLKLQRKMYDRK